MKRRIAILLSVLMVFSSVASISAATDDEIEKRIDKIMEEDLRYYREGRDYGREKSASGFLGFAGGANAAAAVEEYDSVEYEDGADYDMAESSNEDVYAEAAAPEAGQIPVEIPASSAEKPAAGQEDPSASRRMVVLILCAAALVILTLAAILKPVLRKKQVRKKKDELEY